MNFIKVTATMCDDDGKTIFPVCDREFLLNVDLILIIEDDGIVITKESNSHSNAIQLTVGNQHYNSIRLIQVLVETALSF
jgi:hypothetical protein